MEARQRRVSVETFAKSGPAAVALAAELKRRDDANMADPSDEECIAICAEADRVATYGVGYKVDRRGEPIPQGIGSPGRESINHFNSIRRYEGPEAYAKAVKEFVRRDPERAKKLGLELPRVGA